METPSLADTYAEAAVKKIVEALPMNGSAITISDDLLKNIISLAYTAGRSSAFADAMRMNVESFEKALSRYPLLSAADRRREAGEVLGL